MERVLCSSKKWFIIPFLILTIGLSISIFLGLKAYNAVRQPKLYVSLPGEQEIMIQEAGINEIYYEYMMSNQINEDIIFYFKNIETGDIAESYHSNISSTYEIGGVNGVLVAQVQLPQVGKYVLTSTYNKTDPTLIFLIGKSVIFTPVLFEVFAILVVVFSFISGIASLIIILIKRSSVKTNN